MKSLLVPAGGYADFARLPTPLIERDRYSQQFTTSITPPNLVKAAHASSINDMIVLTSDQPVVWTEKLLDQFYLDGVAGKVASRIVKDKTLTLHLTAASQAKCITYLDCKSWPQAKPLMGENGIAAYVL